MEDNKPNDHNVANLAPGRQQVDELNCPSHSRKRWTIDRTSSSWHDWLPLHDRPHLRWALAIILAIAIIAIMIVGIVYTIEYYAMYYATGHGGWLYRAAADRNNNSTTDSSQAIPGTMTVEESYPDVVWHTMDKEEEEDAYWITDQRYRPMILQMAPCIQKYSCAQYDKPSVCCNAGLFCHQTDTDLSNSGVYCCNNSTCPSEGHLTSSAICPQGLMQCGEAEGGGCCPGGSQCAEEGCLLFDQHKPPATPSTPASSNTVQEPHVMATVYKIGEVPSQAVQRRLGYTSHPVLEGLVLVGLVFFTF
ncbi:hypothetical protein PFICI_08964 [Pestalotiopsis fici W106-1]|uniref:Uncharacterized protein n=1 Tax=Pestalotiopsis fici (strain W106-1 / CGMCC3.15140) TaxID=1229662 RepID=W3X1R8_PESFW|nr:uncharacterized protein PFICI_08964 [Pestalotiopsis fici W106-1]ETS79111.1 hypothetical protein PFICI_08964 [Pestalotiopsis fici W106-1]